MTIGIKIQHDLCRDFWAFFQQIWVHFCHKQLYYWCTLIAPFSTSVKAKTLQEKQGENVVFSDRTAHFCVAEVEGSTCVPIITGGWVKYRADGRCFFCKRHASAVSYRRGYKKRAPIKENYDFVQWHILSIVSAQDACSGSHWGKWINTLLVLPIQKFLDANRF